MPDRSRKSTDPEFLRRDSVASNLSDVPGPLLGLSPSPQAQRKRSQDRRNDPLGITVLHEPDIPRTIDVLFIHGLGGTSLRSWCKGRDPELLWPKLWLPHEPGLSSARILTFGYNAHFGSTKGSSSQTIGDFATDLLFRMKYGDAEIESLGDAPIIVVAHSMGGLVFKRAFIQGSLNEEYQGITQNIKAVLFLATPHRGTDLAETLNRILSSSIFGHSSKDYLAELTRNSVTIDELNESFRHHASKLRLFSFYETMVTPVGPRNIMILDKSSSLLGYPNETAQPLNANHHDVCKFTDMEDPNYISVRGALRSVAGLVVDNTNVSTEEASVDSLEDIREYLAVAVTPADDATALRVVRREGTCEDFLTQKDFKQWIQAAEPCILWVSAPPGNGKSIQASLVIDHLLEQRYTCCYYFFKYGDKSRRSISHCFRSLALQMASQIPAVRQTMSKHTKAGMQLDKVDGPTAWRIVFQQILSTVKLPSNIYWMVDGLDESESSKSFIEAMSTLGTIPGPIRLLVFSRPLPVIKQAFQKASKSISVTTHFLQQNIADIRQVALEEMDYLVSDESFKQSTVAKIARRSNGNFLWASLVIKRVLRCHRSEDVEKVLAATPDGMEQLYLRMCEAISALEFEEDIALSRLLLGWATYSRRPLTVDELKEAYPSEIGTIIDLRNTASQVGGEFITVDSNGQLVLVHHTAREYLRKAKELPFSMDAKVAHESHLVKCFALLCSRNLRTRINQKRLPHFLEYAATSWAFHLDHIPIESDKALEYTMRFFRGPFILPWVQYLAGMNKLVEVVKAAKSLTAFVQKRRKFDADKSPLLHRISDLEYLGSWSVDLLRVTAKFGTHLVKDPSLVYKLIPHLCPAGSMIHQKFATKNDSFSISGLSLSEWDDCLARVTTSPNRAMHIAVSDQFLVVGDDAPAGNITIWRRSTFQRDRYFSMSGPIFHLCLSTSGSLLACYSSKTTYIWQVETGTLIAECPNPNRARAIAMNFGPNDGSLTIATDLRKVHKLILNDKSSGWTDTDPSLLEEANVGEGAFLNAPSTVAFNSDNTQMAIGYRGFPLSVWNIDPPEMVARIRRRVKAVQTTTSNTFFGAMKVTWHPSNNFVLGIYYDGNIFKWSPADDTVDEIRAVDVDANATPSEIECSPNGLVFATGDVKGSVKIYDFYSLALTYKLTSEDIIQGICFSPDSRIFYDLRGLYCNVWEPNCLVRLIDDRASNDSDSSSCSGCDDVWSDTDDARSTNFSFAASEAHAGGKPAITAVASNSSLQLIAYGNEDGTVEIYDMIRDFKHVVAKSAFAMGVVQVVWSPTGDHLAYVTWNGRVTVKKITLDGEAKSPKLAVKQIPVFSEKSAPKRGAPKQILFNQTGELLLISGREKTQILRLPTGEMVSENLTPETHGTWERHPSDDQLLLRCSCSKLYVLAWSTLDAKGEISTKDPLATSDHLQNPQLEQTYLSNDLERLLVVMNISTPDRRWKKRFSVIDLTGLNAENAAGDIQTVTSSSISAALLEIVEQVVGILPDGRMIYLDEDLWVCTAQINGGTDSIRRHFFIPRDWVNAAGLGLCQVLPDGTLLCPCKGEVAVIRSDLASLW